MSFSKKMIELERRSKNGQVLLSDVNELFLDEDINIIVTQLEARKLTIVESFGKKKKEVIEDEISADIDEVEIEQFLQEINTLDLLPQTLKVDDPVKMYLKEIGEMKILTQEEETSLAMDIINGNLAKAQLESIEEDNYVMSQSTIDELQKLVYKMELSKEKLVNSNLKLVVSIAKKFVNRGLPLLDLVQEGNMGLMKAVDKFDSTKGFKFSTYSTWWIRQAISRAVSDQARTIRIPVHMVETINKLVRTQRQLVQELCREPTVQELADAMNLPVEKITEIQRTAQEPVSLEAQVGEEEDSTLGDFVRDKNTIDPFEYTAKKLLRKELDDVLEELTDREEKVLRLRFGLVDGRQYTLEEVGREFSVTRERIRQIESKALRKLKHPSRNKKLKDFMTR